MPIPEWEDAPKSARLHEAWPDFEAWAEGCEVVSRNKYATWALLWEAFKAGWKAGYKECGSNYS